MPVAESIVAVSISEWLNWLEHGELRCLGSRIRRVRHRDDAEGLSRVLDAAPYEKTFDEQALLLAVLKEDYLRLLDTVDSADGPDTFWLPVEAVREFLPLSERGARLLEADAERARCLVGAPKYQAAWQKWALQQNERRAHRRGIRLVHALGLEPGLPLADLPVGVPSLLDASELPGADRRERYSGTCAMAWAEALAIARDVAGADAGAALQRNEDIRRFIEKRAMAFRLSDEDMFADDAKRVAGVVENLPRGTTGVIFPFTAAVVVCHYRHVQQRGQEFDPAVFGRNLAGVRDAYGLPYATLAAYLVGRCLGDTPVNALWYATHRASLPALDDQSLPFEPLKLVPPPPTPVPDAGAAAEPEAGTVVTEATPNGVSDGPAPSLEVQPSALAEGSGAETPREAPGAESSEKPPTAAPRTHALSAKGTGTRPGQSEAFPASAGKAATGKGKGKGTSKGTRRGGG